MHQLMSQVDLQVCSTRCVFSKESSSALCRDQVLCVFPTPSPTGSFNQRHGLSKLIVFGLCIPEISVWLSLNSERILLAQCNPKSLVVGLDSSEVWSRGLRMSKQTWFLSVALLTLHETGCILWFFVVVAGWLLIVPGTKCVSLFTSRGQRASVPQHSQPKS